MKDLFENIKNARIWVVKDLRCKIYNTNEEIEIKQYSKGKIIDNYNKKMVIAIMENGKEILIEKKYILINLPDIMQKEVQYEITNAKSSIYNIHGNKIPNVSGEKLYTKMGEDLKVPLMYYTAMRLYLAEEKALNQNVTLKIYDTYRPYSVTKYLYENTLLVADKYKEYFNAVVNNFEYRLRGALMYKGGNIPEDYFNNISAHELFECCFRNGVMLKCIIDNKDMELSKQYGLW